MQTQTAKLNKTTASQVKDTTQKLAQKMKSYTLHKNAALLAPSSKPYTQHAKTVALSASEKTSVHTNAQGQILVRRIEQRSLAQNACMWALLTDISQQVNWCGGHLSKEEWKHLLAASLKRRRMTQHKVQGQTGAVLLNTATSTSMMNVKEMDEFIDYIAMFGLTQGVEFGGAQAVKI